MHTTVQKSFCFAVLIDSGSRYEVAHPSGVSHFLEKLAFGVSRIYYSCRNAEAVDWYDGGCQLVYVLITQTFTHTFLPSSKIQWRTNNADTDGTE